MALPNYRRHMSYFFVNLLSEKIFKLSVLGVSSFDRILSISVCKARFKRRTLHVPNLIHISSTQTIKFDCWFRRSNFTFAQPKEYGGDSHMKAAGILVVSRRGVISDFGLSA